jgi:hypothetical protein
VNPKDLGFDRIKPEMDREESPGRAHIGPRSNSWRGGGLAAKLRRTFPRSLNGAPAVLPTMETPLRRLLEKWFDAIHTRPTVAAEVEDAALMNHFGAEGLGFIPAYSAVLPELAKIYGLRKFGLV